MSKKFLSILLSLSFIIVPIILLGIAVYRIYTGSTISDNIVFFISGALIFVIGRIFKKPLRTLEIYARRSADYDEFGRSKRKGNYEYLSREEQDAIDLQKTAKMETILSTSVLKKMTHEGSKNPEKDMEKLIGLEPVKSKMQEMVARMQFENERYGSEKGRAKKQAKLALSNSSNHMCFYGSPGTGKTSVARILAGFLYKYHYIKQNKCVEIDGNFLKAGEDTAMKTELIIQQAFDGVLFIDEAYSLTNSYSGIEAIATLIKQMEDNRGRFVLILAGYTNEMKELLNQNPGFSSRIKDYLVFPDYSSDELREIFVLMAKEQGFTIDIDAYHNFDRRITNEQTFNSFGNARTVRNVLDEAIDKHALNYTTGKLDKSQRMVLHDVDISTVPKNSDSM